MQTDIKCPNCGHSFEPSGAMREEMERELRTKVQEWQKKKTDEFQVRLEDEKRRLQQAVETNLRKSISADFENQLRLLERSNTENEGKLKEARRKELEFLQKERELKTREAELEITTQRKLQEERAQLSEEIRKLEHQKTEARETEFQMRMKELEKQLADQKKLADEMRRKADQGSMKLQGEVQELALEELLRVAFPFDVIHVVGKGVRGADCIQIIHNNFGQECGKIIYESKRTNSFMGDWIEKLKSDMRSLGADISVLVTRTMPSEMECFGLKDGVWICSFTEVKALASALRDGVIRTYNATKSNDNNGDKMHLLYSI